MMYYNMARRVYNTYYRGPGSSGVSGHLNMKTNPYAPAKKGDVFSKIGVKTEDENSGVITSGKVAYLGVRNYKSDLSKGSVTVAACGALARHILYNELKWDCNDWLQPLKSYSLYSATQTYGYFPMPFVRFIWKQYADGLPVNQPTFTYDNINIDETDTFYSWVIKIATMIRSRVQPHAARSSNWELVGYQVPTFDSTTDSSLTDDFQFSYSHLRPLSNHKITVYCNVVVTVQNATGADGTGGDPLSLMRVDANPLQGKCFLLKGQEPLLREKIYGYTNNDSTGAEVAPNILHNNYQLWDRNHDGIVYLGQGTTSFNGPLAQVPDGYDFKACMAEKFVSMAPGEIQKHFLKFKFEGTLMKFFIGVATEATNAGNLSSRQEQNDQQFGKVCLLALEQVMNGTGNTTLNFEASFSSGAYIRRGQRENMSKLTGNENFAAATNDGEVS